MITSKVKKPKTSKISIKELSLKPQLFEKLERKVKQYEDLQFDIHREVISNPVKTTEKSCQLI